MTASRRVRGPVVTATAAESASGADLRALCGLSREALYAHAVQYFRHGGGTEPEVALIVYGGACAVLKDYGRGGGWFARVLGPLLIGREAGALERLAGLAGVPALYRRIDARAVLMEYVPAEPWRRARPPAESFDRLHALVAAMHTRGVAHCDLRSPSNILVDAEGQPYLVDFVARVCRGRAWNAPWNRVFAKFCQADRGALAKLKVKQAPELASAAERRLAQHRSAPDRFFRALGARIRSFTRLFVKRT